MRKNHKTKELFELSIEELLSNLNDDALCLSINLRNLTQFPEIQRFQKLTYINCSYNKLTELPAQLFHELPQLISFYCTHNTLKRLPNIPDQALLQVLICYDNELEQLPPFSMQLLSVDCSKNRLTRLPPLNACLIEMNCSHNLLCTLPALHPDLCVLNCSHNRLQWLPSLPPTLRRLNYLGNDILSKLFTPDFGNFYSNIMPVQLRKEADILHRFVSLRYSIKYACQFHKWMWKSRETKIKKKFHPDHLVSFIKSLEDQPNPNKRTLDDFLDSWY